MTPFTVFHVAISLLGIVSGLVVLLGMLARERPDSWTGLFLVTTAATSLTGLLLPAPGFTPAVGVALVSIVVLSVAILARYVGRLAGAWRWIYVFTATLALCFNVFVLVVQLFQKVPALKALAPTQSEPPFLIAQVAVLAFFAVLAIAVLVRFRPVEIKMRSRSATGGGTT